MSVEFAYNGTTVELQNPQLLDRYATRLHQALGLSADGSRRRYAKGENKEVLRLLFDNLRESEKTELEDFYNDTVDGMETEFVYTDHEGVAWDARFLNEQLEFVEVDDESASSGTFDVGEATYPTTTRESGVWRVEVMLEAVVT